MPDTLSTAAIRAVVPAERRPKPNESHVSAPGNVTFVIHRRDGALCLGGKEPVLAALGSRLNSQIASHLNLGTVPKLRWDASPFAEWRAACSAQYLPSITM